MEWCDGREAQGRHRLASLAPRRGASTARAGQQAITRVPFCCSYTELDAEVARAWVSHCSATMPIQYCT